MVDIKSCVYLFSYPVRQLSCSLYAWEKCICQQLIFRVASFAIRGALNLDKARVNRGRVLSKLGLQ